MPTAESSVLGLHHVTATVDDAQADLDFYVGVLGLRLLKKTVNFDNRHVFHFYYGNEHGTPGTIWTTFPYRGQGVAAGRKGVGQIEATAFSVPADSLDLWRERLRERAIAAREVDTRFGERALACADPSGLNVLLVAAENDTRPSWTRGGVEAAAAIRGLHSVVLNVQNPAPTVSFLTSALGFSVIDQSDGRTRLAVRETGPGHIVDVAHSPGPRAINGLGTVHHVAFAVATAEAQLIMRQELLLLGCQVTPVLDRQYFTSIYFREPGGVLFEIATVPPGFTIDEPLDSLGHSLKLPPWEEANRATIETGLASVVIPSIDTPER